MQGAVGARIESLAVYIGKLDAARPGDLQFQPALAKPQIGLHRRAVRRDPRD